MLGRIKRMVNKWLPGIISGGADNDPAGITTYSLSGVKFGYQQLWLMILATPMLLAVQAMCARLSDVTRKGLMTIIRQHYAPVFATVASIVLIFTNTATLGADLAAMADALGLVTKTSLVWWVVPVALLIWYIIVFQNYKVIEKYLFLLSFVFVAYIISAFLARPVWRDVVWSIFVPRMELSPGYFMAALSIMGTTITPFLFFWQGKERLEEHKSPAQLLRVAEKEDVLLAPGIIFSGVISVFIIISTGAVFHANGITDILTANDAARALEPFVGPYAKYLFSIGIIGSGLLAVPVIAASTAYTVAEAFGWRDSLSDSVNHAKGFYTVLTASFIVGVGIALSGISPITALWYSQILAGILAPLLLVLIMFMCNDKKIMGEHVNKWFDNIFGIITILVMVFATVGLFWQIVIAS